jgi:hypothetical protein
MDGVQTVSFEGLADSSPTTMKKQRRKRPSLQARPRDWLSAVVALLAACGSSSDNPGFLGDGSAGTGSSSGSSGASRSSSSGINLASDSQQQTVMQSEFTMFWNDSNVKGITLWGYIVGATWQANTGLMTSSGTMRPAMSWLVTFLQTH